ncbi:MAG: 50S ribosomal protein L22 [bacterium]
MEKATAQLKNLRIAPRKVRLVCGVVRGLTVNDAFAQLQAMTARSSGHVMKLLKSAVANAKNKQMTVSRLVIDSIRVDEGTMLKRHRARARGVANPIHKKFSHVTVVIREDENARVPRFSTFYDAKKENKKGKEKNSKQGSGDTNEKQKQKSENDVKQKSKKGKDTEDKKKIKESEPNIVKKVFQRKSV